MKRQLLFIILAASSFSGVCRAQGAAPAVLRGTCFNSTMHVDGKPLSYSVCDNELDSSPDWLDPENTQPPFSTAEAIRLTRTALVQYVSDPDNWRVSSIELRSLGGKAKWFYVVEWERKTGHVGDGVNIPVLMNGRVIRLTPS